MVLTGNEKRKKKALDALDERISKYRSMLNMDQIDTRITDSLDSLPSSSGLRRQFLDSLSDDDRRDDDSNQVAKSEDHRDHAHTISYGYSKHQDDDAIFDLSDEENEDESSLHSSQKSSTQEASVQSNDTPPNESSDGGQDLKHDDFDATDGRDLDSFPPPTEQQEVNLQEKVSTREYANYSPFDALEEEDYQLPKDAPRQWDNYRPFNEFDGEDTKPETQSHDGNGDSHTTFKEFDEEDNNPQTQSHGVFGDSHSTLPQSNLTRNYQSGNDLSLQSSNNDVVSEELIDSLMQQSNSDDTKSFLDSASSNDSSIPSDDGHTYEEDFNEEDGLKNKFESNDVETQESHDAISKQGTFDSGNSEEDHNPFQDSVSSEPETTMKPENESFDLSHSEHKATFKSNVEEGIVQLEESNEPSNEETIHLTEKQESESSSFISTSKNNHDGFAYQSKSLDNPSDETMVLNVGHNQNDSSTIDEPNEKIDVEDANVNDINCGQKNSSEENGSSEENDSSEGISYSSSASKSEHEEESANKTFEGVDRQEEKDIYVNKSDELIDETKSNVSSSQGSCESTSNLNSKEHSVDVRVRVKEVSDLITEESDNDKVEEKHDNYVNLTMEPSCSTEDGFFNDNIDEADTKKVDEESANMFSELNHEGDLSPQTDDNEMSSLGEVETQNALLINRIESVNENEKSLEYTQKNNQSDNNIEDEDSTLDNNDKVVVHTRKEVFQQDNKTIMSNDSSLSFDEEQESDSIGYVASGDSLRDDSSKSQQKRSLELKDDVGNQFVRHSEDSGYDVGRTDGENNNLDTQSSEPDPLESLLRERYNKKKEADLHDASFNPESEEMETDEPPAILLASSSLSTTSSKFQTSAVSVITSVDHQNERESPLPYNIYSQRNNSKAESTNFVGNRLYNQGIQKQRKQAIVKKDTHQKRGNKLDLATRSYNERSASNLSKRNGTSVYNRLYNQTKEKEQSHLSSPSSGRPQSRARSVKAPPNRTNGKNNSNVPRNASTTRSVSTTRNSQDMGRNSNATRSSSTTRGSRGVGKGTSSSPIANILRSTSTPKTTGDNSVFTRLYNGRPIRAYKDDEESIAAVGSGSRSCSRRTKRDKDKEPIGDRLYNLAKKKRLLEMEREKRREEARFQSRPQSRSRAISSPSAHGSDIFSRLYYQGISKRDEKERILHHHRDREARDEEMRKTNTEKRSEREAQEGFSRLFSKSYFTNLEGKQRREKIEMKSAPRYATPSRKITIEEANDLYNRGMVQKMALEIKREEGCLDKTYVSPLLNPLVEDSQRSRTSSVTKERTASRIRPRSRLRGESPASNRPASAVGRNVMPSRPRGSTPKKKAPSTQGSRGTSSRSRTPSRSLGLPNIRTRSPTPTRLRDPTPVRKQKQNSTRQLLRKLEMQSGSKNLTKKETDSNKTVSTKETSSTSLSAELTPTNDDEKQEVTIDEPIKIPYLTHARSGEYSI